MSRTHESLITEVPKPEVHVDFEVPEYSSALRNRADACGCAVDDCFKGAVLRSARATASFSAEKRARM